MDTNVLARAVNNIVNQQLLDTHTNFIGKIVSMELNVAKIQPLMMYKVYGQTAQTTAVLTDVPVLYPYKSVWQVEAETGELIGIVQKEISAGDSVLCCVCERDITEAKKGNLATPSLARRHNLSDSVVIMGLSEVEYVTVEEGE